MAIMIDLELVKVIQMIFIPRDTLVTCDLTRDVVNKRWRAGLHPLSVEFYNYNFAIPNLRRVPTRYYTDTQPDQDVFIVCFIDRDKSTF